MPTPTSIARQITQLKSAACFIKCDSAKQTSAWLNERLIEQDFERVITCDVEELATVRETSFHLTEVIAAAAFTLWPEWFEDKQQQPSEAITNQSVSNLIALWEHRLKSSGTLISRQWLSTADQCCRDGLVPLSAKDSLTRQLRNLSRCLAAKFLAILIRVKPTEHDLNNLLALSKVCEWFATESNSSTVLIVESTAYIAGLEALPELVLPELPELQIETQPNWPPKHRCPNGHKGRVDDSTNQTLEYSTQDPISENSNTSANDDLNLNKLTTDSTSQQEAYNEETRQNFGPFIGRPHPGSPGEQRMADALSKDAELAELFEFNQRITTTTGSKFIVDLIWKAGQVIVEIDGYSYHSNRPIFYSDRQRDYELVISNYIVLRVTHDEVMSNLPNAISKLRNVVSWRRNQISKGQLDAN